MEVVKIKGDEKSGLFELRGEGFTLASALEEALWEVKNVKEAASFREHPYLSEVKLWVKVDKGSIKDVLEEAANNLLETIEKIEKEF